MNRPASGPIQIAHHIPGRTRLRLPRDLRSRSEADAVCEALAAVDGVRNVSVDSVSGSVVIEYAPDTTKFEDIGRALASIRDVQPPSNGHYGRRTSDDLVEDMRSVVRQWNDSVSKSTHGSMDLRSLVPLLFVGGAALQFGRGKGGLLDIPGYLLLYYAFDSFVKLNSPAASPTERLSP